MTAAPDLHAPSCPARYQLGACACGAWERAGWPSSRPPAPAPPELLLEFPPACVVVLAEHDRDRQAYVFVLDDGRRLELPAPESY